MVELKRMYQDMILEMKEQQETEIYKLNMLTFESPLLIAGIDSSTQNRQLYIDLGEKAWEKDQLQSLPKWRGLAIRIEHFENLFLIKNHFFLVLQQEAEQDTDIFEVVLQNLINHLFLAPDEESLFTTVYQVLDRWRGFFQRNGFQKLSDEQQRGLFGELWFINEWLKRFPGQPPLLIEQWEGPTKGRLDFKNVGCGLEIKTAIERLSKKIKIASEDQLKLTKGINTIYIYVCYLEVSKTHGISLEELAAEVRAEISKRSDRLALKFNDLLTDIGFRAEEYTDVLFYIENTEVYEASEGFPRILKEDLPIGISHVSYDIDLTHCEKFKRDQEEIYQYFRVDG